MVRFWNRVEKMERPKGKTFRCKWQRKRNPFDCIQSLSEKQKETSNTNAHVTGREKPSERQLKQIKKRQPLRKRRGGGDGTGEMPGSFSASFVEKFISTQVVIFHFLRSTSSRRKGKRVLPKPGNRGTQRSLSAVLSWHVTASCRVPLFFSKKLPTLLDYMKNFSTKIIDYDRFISRGWTNLQTYKLHSGVWNNGKRTQRQTGGQLLAFLHHFPFFCIKIFAYYSPISV